MTGIKLILSTQYFVYFGILGVFLPFFNLYCYHIGFTGFEIGALSALKTLTTALFPMAWGALSDRFNARKPIFVLCSFAAAGVWALFLLTTDFWIMFTITAFYGLFHAPLISFLESFSMDILGHEKTGYGRLRLWGSVSFIITVLIVGHILDMTGVGVILVIILAGSMLQSVLSLSLPKTGAKKEKRLKAEIRTFLTPKMALFLAAAFLMLVSHGTYYGFFSIHLEDLGFSRSFIGLAWGLASVAEIGIMFFSTRIFARFSCERVLAASFIMAAIRWLIMANAVSAGAIIFAQLFHAFSYGAFHIASILYIDANTPEESKTFGQAVNNAVTYGFGIMVGFLANGWLFERLGAGNLFFISACIAAAGGLIMGVEIMVGRYRSNTI
ncbi:MAG: MFS transporter [Deltaproteobacteria bacterium]|nr:MFS transporter [Deltaproteobacteria bacterium]